MNEPAQLVVEPSDLGGRLPKRFWWLKRILVASGIIVLGVGVLRWRVGVVAEERLGRKIAELRAAGEPLDPEDFNSEPVPDELNAVITLKQAAEAFVNWSGKGVSFSDIIRNPSLCSSQPDQVYKLIDNNPATLRLLREARLRPGVDWGVRWSSPMLGVEFPNVMRFMDLARLLCASAIYHDSRGEHGKAMEELRDALSLANRMGDVGFMLPTLIGLGTSKFVVRTIEQLVPTLLVDEGNGLHQSTHPARRPVVEALIRDLLDEEALGSSLIRGCQFWRASLHDSATFYVEGAMYALSKQRSTRPRGVWKFRRLLYEPVAQLDLARVLDHNSAYVRAAYAPSYPQAETLLPEPLSFDSVLEQQTYLLGVSLRADGSGALLRARRELSTRRLAATALAIRLFEIDNGRRPADLQELVPRYLPNVPIDPMSASGEDVLYFPTNPDDQLALRHPNASLGIIGQVFQLNARELVASDEPAGASGRSAQGADQGDDVQNQPRNSETDQPADEHP